MRPPRITEPILLRFWAKVSKDGPDNCWEWTASISLQGYGQIHESRCIGDPQIRHLAHRFSWIIHYGPIPASLCVLHKCDNRRCVNPDHLFLGTKTDNALDRDNKGRTAKGEHNGMAKLSWSLVRQMRKLHKQGGYTEAVLGKLFNISPAMAGFIVRNQCWMENT